MKHNELVARLATSNISTKDFSYLTTVLMETKTCEWKVEYDYSIYTTSCGNSWQFTEGDLEDNVGVNFCPYCGNKIKGVTVD